MALAGLWVATLAAATAHGFVIAPPWANPSLNPCSETSWQLIFWPPDGRCYQIFKQGPCPNTQELAFHAVTKRATCRCPKSLIYWPATDRCYPQHSRGPCEANQYLNYDKKSKNAICKQTKICENGWIFWPPMQDCFQLYTQGPCHKGDLLIMNPLTAEPFCGCDPLLLRQYYSPPLKLCYEHLTRGPCEAGLLFAYNHTSDATQCLCDANIVNFHGDSGQCFQFNTKGPCSKGQMFQYSKTAGRGECLCRKGYVFWPANGECYKAFTAGPCRPGQFLIPHPNDENIGQCVQNPCPRAHLYFPAANRFKIEPKCHKVGSRGPCPLGQLVVFEKYSGKSYRGECGCSPGYNQNYWPETGQCFEWYTQGPCKDSFLFQYNREAGRTECVCDEQEGFVFWNETQKCYRVYTQGPCPDNAWLIPADDLTEVFCECQAGYHFSPTQYACRRTPMVKPLGSNPGLHLLLKNHKMYSQTSSQDYDEDEIENATDEPTSGIEWSRGIFVSAGEADSADSAGEVTDTARIDTGSISTITDKINWLKNRHKWEWWQKARQPRQPWSSTASTTRAGRRRKRRRRLVPVKLTSQLTSTSR